MTTSPHWLDILPAIPLARGVPVVSTSHRVHAVVVSATVDEVILADAHAVDAAPCSPNRWRVDLDDPQGMAWALRRSPEDAWGDGFGHVMLVLRHLRGQTTEADKVVVACALAEVAG